MARTVYLDFQDGGGLRNVSSLVKYDTLEIDIGGYSDTYHYVQNTASFEIIYNSVIYPLLQSSDKDIIVQITESVGSVALFYGIIPMNRISYQYNGILNITSIKLEAEDHGTYLDKPVGGSIVGGLPTIDVCWRNYQLMNATTSGTSIVHRLAYLAGFTNTQIDSSVTISGTLNAFVPPSSSDSIRDLMDALLFEYGYTLHFNEAGQISPIKWIQNATAITPFTESNMIGKLGVQNSIKTYKGAEVVYYELAEGVTTSGQTDILLYRDSELPYASDGAFLGYPIISGYTYPPETNVNDETTGQRTKVYQVYEDSAIQYWTNAAIKNKLDYNYKAFTSDFSSIVATSGWRLDYSAGANVSLVTSEFYNTQARIVYSGMAATDNNLYYSNIYGKVLYKTAERTSKVELESNTADINEYVSTFIFDKTNADILVKAMVAQYDIDQVEYSITASGRYSVGTRATIVAGDGTNTTALISARRYGEKSLQYQYTLKNYSTATPDLTSQTTTHASSVTAKTMLDTFATKEVVNTTISGILPVMITDLAPKYLGRYEHAHPASYNSGDWWTVYHSDDTAPQRGVWYSNDGTPERITASSTPPLQAKFGVALTDVAWAEEQGTYGVAANYGIEALFQSLGAVTAFINSLFVQQITVPAGGRIRYETGAGVQKRCVQLADEKIDWIDIPDTVPATDEQLRFRLGRLGVGGAVLADGDLIAPITTQWGTEQTVASGVSSTAYSDYIQLDNGEIRIAYGRTSSYALVERTWNGSTWDSEQVITTSGYYPCYIQREDGELRIAYRRTSDNYLVEKIWNGASWDAATPVTSGTVAFSPSYVELSTGELRIAYERGSDNYLVEKTWNGVSWDDEQIITASGSRMPSYIQRKNGELRIAYQRLSDTTLVEKIWNGASWDNATSIDSGYGISPTYIEDVSEVLRIAYEGGVNHQIVERIWNGTIWDDYTAITGEFNYTPNYIQLLDGNLRLAYFRNSDSYLVERTLQRYAQVGAGIIEDDGTFLTFGDGTVMQKPETIESAINMGTSLATTYTFPNMDVGEYRECTMYGRKNSSTEVFGIVLPATGTYRLYRLTAGAAASVSMMVTATIDSVYCGGDTLAGGTTLSFTTIPGNNYIGAQIALERVT